MTRLSLITSATGALVAGTIVYAVHASMRDQTHFMVAEMRAKTEGLEKAEDFDKTSGRRIVRAPVSAYNPGMPTFWEEMKSRWNVCIFGALTSLALPYQGSLQGAQSGPYGRHGPSARPHCKLDRRVDSRCFGVSCTARSGCAAQVWHPAPPIWRRKHTLHGPRRFVAVVMHNEISLIDLSVRFSWGCTVASHSRHRRSKRASRSRSTRRPTALTGGGSGRFANIYGRADPARVDARAVVGLVF